MQFLYISEDFLYHSVWDSIAHTERDGTYSCTRVSLHCDLYAPRVIDISRRLYEDDAHSVVDVRTDSLQSLRELGPPDLVHLVKQPVKSTTKQTGVYHHVTGIDASSSASLAAYINTLTFMPNDKQNKVVSGLYWYATVGSATSDGQLTIAAATMPSQE